MPAVKVPPVAPLMLMPAVVPAAEVAVAVLVCATLPTVSLFFRPTASKLVVVAGRLWP